MTSFKSSMSDIKHQIAQLKNENSKYLLKIQQLKRELDQVSKEKFLTNQTLEKVEEECSGLQESQQKLEVLLQKAEKENCISCERICYLEAETNSNSHDIFELNKKLESSDYELKHFEKNYHACFTERNVLLEKYEEMQKSYQEKVDDMELIINEKKEKENELLLQIRDSKTNSNKLTAKLDNCQQSNIEKEEEINEFKEEIASLSAKCCKLRVNKKKYKAVSQRLEELNTSNEKKLEEMDALKEKGAEHDKTIVSLSADLKHLRQMFADQKTKIKNMEEERDELKQHQSTLEQKERHLSATQVALNQSIGDLETNNDERLERIKYLENDVKKKVMLFEASNQKSIHTIKRMEQDLDMTRSELKERRREVSELKQENLEKEFLIQENERTLKEKEVVIQLRGKEEQLVLEKNHILTTELEVMKVKNKMKTKTEEEKAKNDANESVALMQLMKNLKMKRDERDLKMKREERSKIDHQQKTIEEQNDKIETLGRQLKSEENNYRSELIEKTFLKDELDRVKKRQIVK